MNRKTFNIVTIIIAVVYALILILGNVYYRSMPVAVMPGSYADQYADKKLLHKVDVSDSEKGYFDWRYELFEYNTTDNNNLSLERYTGSSRDLVIPAEIKGHMVTRLGKDFFKDQTLNSIYLPVTIISIDAEPVKGLKVYCDKDSIFYRDNQDKGWDLETSYDSTFINFMLGDLPYGYNEAEDSIELTRYYGDSDIIVIPSYINGKPVRTVSFDMLGNFRLVVFPETVTAINGRVSKVLFSAVFFFELIFSIIAFIAVIISVNIILPRYKRDIREYMLSGPQMIISFAFLIGQLYFSIYAIYFKTVPAGKAFLISLLLLAVYVILMFLLQGGREHTKKVDARIAIKTDSMRNLKSSIIGLSDGIQDKEVKKQVERVMEEIKYSPLNSKDPVVEKQMADEIENLKVLISESKNEDILAKCQEIMTLRKKM